MNRDEDFIEELRDWGDIINGSKGSAAVVFVSGDLLHEAASEIKQLQTENKTLHMTLDNNKKGKPTMKNWEQIKQTAKKTKQQKNNQQLPPPNPNQTHTKHQKWLQTCQQLAQTFSTCTKKQYAAIIINPQGHIIATGYNGSPPGHPHCNQNHCPRQQQNSEPGTNYDNCIANHAETNALLQTTPPKPTRSNPLHQRNPLLHMHQTHSRIRNHHPHPPPRPNIQTMAHLPTNTTQLKHHNNRIPPNNTNMNKTLQTLQTITIYIKLAANRQKEHQKNKHLQHKKHTQQHPPQPHHNPHNTPTTNTNQQTQQTPPKPKKHKN